MFKNVRFKSSPGFSLVEILVVLALMGAILLVMIPQFLQLLTNYRVQSAIAQMRTQFRFARNACVAQKVAYRVVIDEAANTYSVEKWNASTSTYETVEGTDFTMPPSVDILSSSTDGPFVFNSRGGCSPSGNIDLQVTLKGDESLTASDQYRLTIRTTGAVEQSKL